MSIERNKLRTKIVCTLGPATTSEKVIEKLIKAGMNVARLNLSHGTFAEHAQFTKTVRALSLRLGIPVGILMDLPGPKYRVAALKGDSVTLKPGAHVTLTTRKIVGDANTVPMTIPYLPKDVRSGDAVLIDDGAMELKVLDTTDTDMKCKVIFGGILTPGRGIVLPGVRSIEPFVTKPLRDNLDFAITQDPDYIALSFVTEANDVTRIKEILREKNSDIPIISKIERRHAVVAFDEILAVSDGIMVARGDMGVNIPLERVPIVQKEIIRKCNQAGKPVITATQMLLSMVNSPRPTRAEVTDVANAIFDGTDAVMLSNETSVGTYPVETVKMMARISHQAESRLALTDLLAERSAWAESQTDELISYNACYTAHRLHAAAIVAFTQSGSTPRRVAKYRPTMPILAITPSRRTYGALLMCWGVQVFLISETVRLMELFSTAAKLVKETGMAKQGDVIVITGGAPVGIAGTTNLLKVENIS
jgi:pyruvate kinase